MLKHLKYSLTGGKELGGLWADVDKAIARSTGREYQINKKKQDVNAAIKAFNEAFGELFKPGSPEYILVYSDRSVHPFRLIPSTCSDIIRPLLAMKSSGMSSCSDEGVGNMAGWTDHYPEIRPTNPRAASQSAAVARVNERTQGSGSHGDIAVDPE